MARLYKTANGGAELLVEKLGVAESFWERGKGLLGRPALPPGEALWIKPCNNIHTFFMKFPIDCIFMDSRMEIKNIARNVAPFRLVGPYWKASSVIETPSGFADAKNLKVGDSLYVVS